VTISEHHFESRDVGRDSPFRLSYTGLVAIIAVLWALAGAANVLTH
jgi:hypothetical protein